jgi:uncharacterized protein YecA (UPF0149 family)
VAKKVQRPTLRRQHATGGPTDTRYDVTSPDHAIELPDDNEERLDDAAAMIPRAILLLRKIVAIRAARKPVAARSVNVKIGRNEPCSCGLGQKFKRCCGSV